MKHNNYIAIGLSAQHLNRADFSLNKRTIAGNLYTRYSAHFDSEIHLKQRVSIQPSVLFMSQGPSMELTPGTSIKFRFKDQLHEDAAFRIGGWLRIVNYLEEGTAPDAFIAFARLDWRRLSFGFSYDFNLSGLKSSNPANNAIELLLSYRFAPKGVKNCIMCRRVICKGPLSIFARKAVSMFVETAFLAKIRINYASTQLYQGLL